MIKFFNQLKLYLYIFTHIFSIFIKRIFYDFIRKKIMLYILLF